MNYPPLYAERIAGTSLHQYFRRMISTLLLLTAMCLSFAVPSMAQTPTVPAPNGYTARFTVKNNCGVNAWMWATPGGGTAVSQSDYWGVANNGRKVCKSDNSTSHTCAGDNFEWKFVIGAGNSTTFNIPNRGAAGGNVRFNLDCANTTGWNAELGQCVIGGSPGLTALEGDLLGTNTLFEPTWGCMNSSGTGCAVNPSSSTSAALSAIDWFDISIVDGYTVPMKLELVNGTATKAGCLAGSEAWSGTFDIGFLDLDSCPTEKWSTMWSETSTIITALQGSGVQLISKKTNGQQASCASPNSYFTHANLGSPTHSAISSNSAPPLNEANWYGCVGSGSGTRTDCLKGPMGNGNWTIAETNYVQHLKAMGIPIYTWQYDDSYGDTQCNYGINMTLTLCPAQAGQIPYNNQKWNFDFMSNTCTAASDGKYESYFDCISVNSFYSQVGTGDASSSVMYCVPDPSGLFTSYNDCRSYKPHSHADHQDKTGVHAYGQKTNSTICATGTPLLLSTHTVPASGSNARALETIVNSTYVASVVGNATRIGKLTPGTWNEIEVADDPDHSGTWTSEFWDGAPDELRTLYAMQPLSFDMSMNRTPGVTLLAKWMFKGTGNATQGDLAGKKVGNIEVYKYMQKYGESKTAARWTMVYGDGHTTNWSGMVDFHGNPTKLDDGSAFFTTVTDYGTILPKDAVFDADTYYYLWASIQNHAGIVGNTSSGKYDLDNSTKYVFDPPRVVTAASGESFTRTSNSFGCTLNPSAGFGLEWLLLLAAPLLGVLRMKRK